MESRGRRPDEPLRRERVKTAANCLRREHEQLEKALIGLAGLGKKNMRPKVRSPVRHALAIVCGLTALTPLTSQDAFAQTIPSYATNAHCQRVAGFGGTFSQSVYGSCLNMEQSAALALQNRWSSIPGSVRERCDRIASFGGSASYSILQNCVDV